MKHRVTLFSSRRLLLLSAALLVLPIAGILLAVFDKLIVGLVFIAGGVILGYLFVRAVQQQAQPWIETSGTGLAYKMPGGEVVSMLWKRIVVAGVIHRPLRLPSLFLYEGTKGRLLQIPHDFSGFRELERTLRARTRFREVGLRRGEKLEDKIRELVRPG